MANDKKKPHAFTWIGEPIPAIYLATKLGISRRELYNRSEAAGTDEGEVLARAKKKPGVKQKHILWEGEMVATSDIAEELGISKQLLDTRISKMGIDCCMTYYPGIIPRRLRQPNIALAKRRQPKSTKAARAARAASEWGMLSGEPRAHNLLKIKVGSFERTLPDRPAGTESPQKYLERGERTRYHTPSHSIRV